MCVGRNVTGHWAEHHACQTTVLEGDNIFTIAVAGLTSVFFLRFGAARHRNEKHDKHSVRTIQRETAVCVCLCVCVSVSSGEKVRHGFRNKAPSADAHMPVRAAVRSLISASFGWTNSYVPARQSRWTSKFRSCTATAPWALHVLSKAPSVRSLRVALSASRFSSLRLAACFSASSTLSPHLP